MQADTLPNACRKYKGLFGLPYSQKEITAETLPLDPIDGELIGALNAKHLKELCIKANIFHFLWLGQLFAILFPATSDFRHWFFQINLPKLVRNLFSVHSEDLLGELQAWPMGFSWSPFAAQSTSMCICALAILAAGFTASFPEQETLLPPFWMRRGGSN